MSHRHQHDAKPDMVGTPQRLVAESQRGAAVRRPVHPRAAAAHARECAVAIGLAGNAGEVGIRPAGQLRVIPVAAPRVDWSGRHARSTPAITPRARGRMAFNPAGIGLEGGRVAGFATRIVERYDSVRFHRRAPTRQSTAQRSSPTEHTEHTEIYAAESFRGPAPAASCARLGPTRGRRAYLAARIPLSPPR